jgi:Putative transposase/Transposase zinc-binding domain
VPPPPHRVAEVFRDGWEAYRDSHRAGPCQTAAARHIMSCRTASLGGRLHRCDTCGAEVPVYNSCRDRHCPTCQTLRKQRWLAQRRMEVLPVPYFHAVFTLPHDLNALIAANRAPLLNELFSTVNWVLQSFAADPQWKLRGRLGFIAVLHTWTQRLTLHYHLHCLVAGGGWDADESAWREANSKFLFGKDALAACFRARFIKRLESLRQRDKLLFKGAATALAESAAWDALIRRLWEVKWVVYPKATSGTPEQTLDYLGRYTHRVAVADHRILGVRDGAVTFTWRDRADGNTQKTMSLTCAEFIGRFLLHVLPKGFQKVRAYGWLSPKGKTLALAAIRVALGVQSPAPPPAGESAPEQILRLTGVDVTLCPACKGGHLVFTGQLPRARDGPA